MSLLRMSRRHLHRSHTSAVANWKTVMDSFLTDMFLPLESGAKHLSRRTRYERSFDVQRENKVVPGKVEKYRVSDNHERIAGPSMVAEAKQPHGPYRP